MIEMTYPRIAAVLVLPLAMLAVACGGEDDPITADNVTLEQCEELFPEDGGDAAGGAGALDGDYDDDGDEDEDDTAIEDKCVELMADAE
jgi:hypothetical protein